MTLGDFSEQASAYRSARPSYPLALIQQLIADAGLVAGDKVADLGAGTGISTKILVDLGFSVTAIEPNAKMREQADVPGARWVNASFERSLLESASQDWAVAAQSFHWADPKRALPEIRRILRPGRLFTILWNNRDPENSEVLGWTEAAIQHHVPEFQEAYRDRDWPRVLESTGDFTFLQHRSAQHIVTMSIDRYLSLWRSHNRLNTIAGTDRFAKLLKELSDYLNQSGFATIEVVYNCDAYSARRNERQG